MQTLKQSSYITVNEADLASSDKAESIRVLHVDDDSSNLEISKQIMKDTDASLEFDCACCVDEAFKKLSIEQYDVVISDYEMPQKDGLQFLSELRKQNNEIPFILFTGKGREDIAVKALNLGADSYINKNGSPETVYCELADAINKTVQRKKSIKLLAKSEAKYRALVENSLQGISILQAAPLRLVFANDAMGKILGYSIQELMSLSPEGITGLVYPEDRAAFFGRMENRLRGEPAGAPYEFRGVRKDGSIIWLSALANRVDYDGQPAVQGMFLDVNESKKTEEILRESEVRYRELANSLPEIVFETDLKGQVVFANQRATEISGYSHQEFEEGLNIMQFLLPEEREKATKNIQRLLSGGVYAPAEHKFIRKDGSAFPALITATPCISKNKLTGLRGLVLDITELKRTEERLEKEKQELNRIIDSSPIIIFYKDKDGKFIRVNEAFAKAQKIPKEEFLGKTVFDLYSAEIARGMANDDLEVLKSGRPRFGIIEQYESASGMRWVQTDKVPILDKNGVSTGLVGFAQDITERKKVDLSLKESEEKFRTLSEELPNMIFINKRGRIVYGNKKCEDITGYTKEELYSPNFNFLSLCAPEYVDAVSSSYSRHMKNEFVPSYDFVLLTKNNERVETIITTKLIDYEGEKAILGIVTDISELKKAEERLQESETKFKMYLENSPVAVFVVNTEGKYEYVNEAASKLLGYSAKELLGMSIPQIAFKDDHQALGSFATLKETGKILMEVRLKNNESKAVVVSLNAVKLPDGKLIAFCENITERKKAEETLTQIMDKLARINEKLGVVGSLTRHDVRNKLSTVTGYAYLLKKKHSDQADIIDGLGKMEQAVAESMKIFDFSRMYEQLGVEELTYINMEDMLNEALALFSGSLNVKIVNNLHELTLLADSFLRQLLFNLIDNSIKHGKKVTTIKVSYEKAYQENLNLIYEDDGIGISADNKLKLFKSGYSTGNSSGYGLFLIKKMMEVYGWTIQENGEPGKGAKFTITIPKLNKSGKENYQTV